MDWDLALRKIFPALFYRLESGQINQNSKIYAVSRSQKSQNQFQKLLRDNLEKYLDKKSFKSVDKLINLCNYIRADVTQDLALKELKSHLRDSEEIVRVFYFSTPSSIFGSITKNLNSLNLINDVSRVVLEKPLGFNSKSSKKINDEISEYFHESQIFRIDHYLGKKQYKI